MAIEHSVWKITQVLGLRGCVLYRKLRARHPGFAELKLGNCVLYPKLRARHPGLAGLELEGAVFYTRNYELGTLAS
ncbi:FAD-binding oxidoreductase [Sesbania bispinosa]|nr:FAD-binding oxidoreductase [Sesbania bispinosa]